MARLAVRHQGQEGRVVARWCCIRLRSLLARVSWVLPGATAGIESYQDLRAVALELRRRARAVESRPSAAALR